MKIEIKKFDETLTTMNIYDSFKVAVEADPTHLAIVKGTNSITFGNLDRQVRQTVSYFLNAGISKGDRVLVFIPMGLDLYRTILSLFKIGAIAVFLDEWSGFVRLNTCCQIAKCKAFIAPLKLQLAAWLSSEIRKIPVWLNIYKYNQFEESRIRQDVSDNDPALITFTTGSTGTPKASVRSHSLLLKQSHAIQKEIGTDKDKICMTNLPIIVLVNLATAATTILPDFNSKKPLKNKPKNISDQINNWRVNRIIASPFFIHFIADYLLASNKKASPLEEIFTGGAPVFPDEAELFLTAFPACKTRIVFGSTEAEPISSIAATDVAKMKKNLICGLPVGRLHPDIQIKIIEITPADLKWDELRELQPDIDFTPGEIIVTGPHVLDTYFKNPEAMRSNKIKDTNGAVWHRTGDSGYMMDGILYLTGRCNTILEYNGHQYRTFIIEYQLRQLKGVRMATLIKLHSSLTLVFETDNTADKHFIAQYCARTFGKDVSLQFLKQIPRDPRHFSKIDYSLLKNLLEKNRVNSGAKHL